MQNIHKIFNNLRAEVAIAVVNHMQKFI